MHKTNSISIIIRASGEKTTGALKQQLASQIDKNDVLIVLDEEISFEEKLEIGFQKGIHIGNEYTIFIDADILLRNKALLKIKKLVNKLPKSNLGFGLKLWDKFYDRPKFRGLHIYRTELLIKAAEFIPKKNTQVRPESFVKEQMQLIGFPWNNTLSNYIAGIHDYNQHFNDIYYKFLIRSSRSKKDVAMLKEKFGMSTDDELKIALKGLKDGEKMTTIINDKFSYNIDIDALQLKENPVNESKIDIFLTNKIIKKFGFSMDSIRRL